MVEQPNSSAPQMPPDAQLMQLGMGMFVSQAIFVAAKLRIPDLLANGPQTVSQLASATSMHENSLFRVMRALASVGAFAETSDRAFVNTPMTELLRSDIPRSMRDMILWMSEGPHWAIYSHMIDSVRTGKPIWEDVHGEPVFPYLFETNKPLGDIFNRAMTSFSQVTIPAILDSYDFSTAKTVADIAGGYGHLLAAVLDKYPSINGVLFDLPQVLAGAPAMMEKHGVSDRVSYVEGSFLDAIPVAADVYMLKHIIHDWYDDTNQTILSNIRASMPEGAKVLLIDAVIPDGNEPHFAKILDLEMLISPGGMERTAAQFKKLLSDSGFEMVRIIPTPSPVSVVEARKAR
jgi:O-methyltransferase domain/Dimerisation domain